MLFRSALQVLEAWDLVPPFCFGDVESNSTCYLDSHFYYEIKSISTVCLNMQEFGRSSSLTFTVNFVFYIRMLAVEETVALNDFIVSLLGFTCALENTRIPCKSFPHEYYRQSNCSNNTKPNMHLPRELIQLRQQLHSN